MKTQRWIHKTGDGKVFQSLAEACEHAEHVYQKTGVFLSIEIVDTRKSDRVAQ